jgi:hypothetical protein
MTPSAIAFIGPGLAAVGSFVAAYGAFLAARDSARRSDEIVTISPSLLLRADQVLE